MLRASTVLGGIRTMASKWFDNYLFRKNSKLRVRLSVNIHKIYIKNKE